MKLIGYHGTTLESAISICDQGIKINNDRHKWVNDIGNGFYTYIDVKGISFPNNPYQNAIRYAKTFKSRKGKDIALVEITVEVDDNKILSLINDENKDNLQQLFTQLFSYGSRLNIPIINSGASKRNNRDGYKLEYIIKYGFIPNPQIIIERTHTDFEHVRSNFDNGVEMVIRDLSVITSKKLIKLR